MKQIATYLSNYAPFKWMYLTPESTGFKGSVVSTLTPFLCIQMAIIVGGFLTLLLHVLSEEDIRKRDKIKTILISFPIIPLECFLSYFLINDILIIVLNIVMSILFFILSFENISVWKNGGGWIYSSLITYFKKIKDVKERIKKYHDRYNQLVKFKL